MNKTSVVIIKWNNQKIKEAFPNIDFSEYNRPEDNDIVEICEEYHGYTYNIISKVSKERQRRFQSNQYLKSDALLASDVDEEDSGRYSFTRWEELIDLLKLSTEELLLEISKEYES